MTNTNKPGIGFWIISIIALIWNAMGVMAYIGHSYMPDDMLQALPEAEQAFYANIPAWVTAAFAISVFAGLLGCIGLLVRKKWAVSLFILSFIGVIAQQVYNFFMQDYIELSGARMIMPIVVFVVCVFLIWYSKDQKAKGILS
jgi:hypothetical protein